MRVLLAPAIIALLIQPAYAQLKPTLNMGMGGDKEVDPRVQQYRNDVEREYKETLDKIPNKEKKNKNDPWADVRGTEPTKKKSN
jgi:hypothetical protein